jgi:hypothetical protein
MAQKDRFYSPCWARAAGAGEETPGLPWAGWCLRAGMLRAAAAMQWRRAPIVMMRLMSRNDDPPTTATKTTATKTRQAEAVSSVYTRIDSRHTHPTQIRCDSHTTHTHAQRHRVQLPSAINNSPRYAEAPRPRQTLSQSGSSDPPSAGPSQG